MRPLLLIAALVACAPNAPPPPDAAPVIAAERAFAARAGEVGWVPAFREFVAPDGQLAQATGFVNAPAELAATPDDGNRNLFWWPAFAGISRSGDFGFTTGAVSFDEARTPRGHYFTVWRRQPDGSWKWIYDGGVGPIAGGEQVAADAEPPSLPVSAGGAGADAVTQVRALETAGTRAYAPDGWSYRTGAAPVRGRASGAVEGLTYELSRVEASAAGDLVLVLGAARWQSEAGEARSLFARMWQLRAEGWVVVYDQLIVPPPPRPDAGPAPSP